MISKLSFDYIFPVIDKDTAMRFLTWKRQCPFEFESTYNILLVSRHVTTYNLCMLKGFKLSRPPQIFKLLEVFMWLLQTSQQVDIVL